LFNLRKGLSGG